MYRYENDPNATFVGSRICFMKDLGLNGNLFGGNMLSWMDEFAAIFTRKETSEPFVVTYKFGEIIFKKPVKEGDLVDFYCHSIEKRTSSIRFNIYAVIGQEEVFRTEAIFVAVDKDGNKVVVNWDKKDKE